MLIDLLTPLLLPLIALFAYSTVTDAQEILSKWSECSRSCGGGVQFRTRSACRPPRGSSSERSCSGGSTNEEYRLCNDNRCPLGSFPFRLFQCASYNHRQVAGRTNRKWIPLEGHFGCELKCRSVPDSLEYSFGKATNGTSCSPENTRVCLHGRCVSVGCDKVLGSTASVDACGQCGGRNDTCLFVRKTFSQSRPPSGFAHVVLIPTGSTNIRVVDSTAGRLVIRDSQRKWRLNGNKRYSWSGSYPLAGSILQYNFTWHNETLNIAGPIDQDLVLMVDFGAAEKARVVYEFRYPLTKTSTAVPAVAAPRRGEKPRDVFIMGQKKNKGHAKRHFKADKEKLSSGLQERTSARRKQIAFGKKKLAVPRHCAPCKKAKNIFQHFCDSDFVVNAQVKGFHLVNNEVRYELHLLRSYKNSVGLGSQEFVWTPDNCHCPRLRLHRHYVIMGRVDHAYSKHESRLVVDNNSFVRRLTDRREMHLLRLARKAVHNCNRIT